MGRATLAACPARPAAALPTLTLRLWTSHAGPGSGARPSARTKLQPTLTCCDERKVEQRVPRQQGEQVDGLAVGPLAEQPGVELSNVCSGGVGGGGGGGGGQQLLRLEPARNGQGRAGGWCPPAQPGVGPADACTHEEEGTAAALTRLQRDAAQPSIEAHREGSHGWCHVAQHEEHCIDEGSRGKKGSVMKEAGDRNDARRETTNTAGWQARAQRGLQQARRLRCAARLCSPCRPAPRPCSWRPTTARRRAHR